MGAFRGEWSPGRAEVVWKLMLFLWLVCFREFFFLLSQAIFNPGFGLFESVRRLFCIIERLGGD